MAARKSACLCVQCLQILTCQVEAHCDDAEEVNIGYPFADARDGLLTLLLERVRASPCADSASLYVRVGLILLRVAMGSTKKHIALSTRKRLALAAASVFPCALDHASEESCGLLVLLNMAILLLLPVRWRRAMGITNEERDGDSARSMFLLCRVRLIRVLHRLTSPSTPSGLCTCASCVGKLRRPLSCTGAAA
jgi:hypothetical protein